MPITQAIITNTNPVFQENSDISDTRPTLKEILNIAGTEKKPLTLVYEHKLFLTVVPIDNVELIEKLEDCIDSCSFPQEQLNN